MKRSITRELRLHHATASSALKHAKEEEEEDDTEEMNSGVDREWRGRGGFERKGTSVQQFSHTTASSAEEEDKDDEERGGEVWKERRWSGPHQRPELRDIMKRKKNICASSSVSRSERRRREMKTSCDELEKEGGRSLWRHGVKGKKITTNQKQETQKWEKQKTKKNRKN